jgi:short-subunit dehydrogenase
VIVVTGASSGIGRATARLAARRGATVVAVARSRESLEQVVKEIRAAGGRAIAVEADVCELEQVEEVARQALGYFGRIDTWVNDAGVSIYGRCDEVRLDDARQLFEVNYWGTVHGCRVAVEGMRQHGGTLINVGSVLSDRAIPLQGHDCASKHAIKAYTDALRMELERDRVPIVVTLVKPSSIATPYPRHAKRYREAQPRLPSRLYAPSVVAEAILDAARRPRRDVTVGPGGLLRVLAVAAPRCLDRFMERALFPTQRGGVAPGAQRSNLHESVPETDREEGCYPHRRVRRSRGRNAATRHPLALAVLGVGAGLLLAARGRGWRTHARA